MSGQLKEVRTRIQSVSSTMQITKAMKMVSAAKLRRAQESIIQMRPYANHLQSILSKMIGGLEGELELNLAEEREINNVLVVLITSNRGLAGSYNSSLIKMAWNQIHEQYADQNARDNVTLMTIGKKGFDFYKKRFDNVNSDHFELFQTLDFEHVGRVAEWITEQFSNNVYDRVEVIYSHFKNAATQQYLIEQFLPVMKPEADDDQLVKRDYIYEPDLKTVINRLIPKILKTQFYKYMLEANASEHGARMTAMDKATENANELLQDLKLTYNRARQAAITTELTEIVGGAAALES